MKKTFIFIIPSATCINCLNPVRHNIINSPFGQQKKLVETSFAFDTAAPEKQKKIFIEIECQDDEEVLSPLLKTIQEDGLQEDAYLYIDEDEIEPQKKKDKTLLRRTLDSHLFKAALGLGVGLIIMLLMMFGGALPLWVMVFIAVTSVGLTAFLGWGSFTSAFKKLKARLLTMDSLFTISTITVFVTSVLSFFVAGITCMFDAPLMVFGFRHLGLWIESSVVAELIPKKRFKDFLLKIYLLESQEKRILTTLKKDDVILMPTGEILPCNGIAEEDILVDEVMISGNNQPICYPKNSPLMAGMRILGENNSTKKIKATSSFKEGWLGQMDEKLKEIEFNKQAPLEEMTTKWLQYFVPIVLILAIILAVVVGFYFTPLLAIKCFVLLLVAACPCTLGMITPLAFKIAMRKGSNAGIQFYNPVAVQAASNIDTVVFDWHGTLTTGLPEVIDCNHENLNHQEANFNVLLALEASFQHPVAEVLKSFAKTKIKPSEALSENIKTEFLTGGIKGTIDDDEFFLGNETLLREQGINVPEVTLEAGQSRIFLVKNNAIVMTCLVRDRLKPDALATIEALKANGMDIHICSGGRNASAFSKILGIKPENIKENCRAATGSGSKEAYIKMLQDKGKQVAMIGDGGNDGPALSQSHFGIAVHSTTSHEIAKGNAKAFVQKGHLIPVLHGLLIARQSVRQVKQNLGISMMYNVGFFLLCIVLLATLHFVLPSWVGVAIMVVQVGCILLNAYLEYRKKLPEVPVKNSDALQGSYHTMQTSYDTKLTNIVSHTIAEDIKIINDRKSKKLEDDPGVDLGLSTLDFNG